MGISAALSCTSPRGVLGQGSRPSPCDEPSWCIYVEWWDVPWYGHDVRMLNRVLGKLFQSCYWLLWSSRFHPFTVYIWPNLSVLWLFMRNNDSGLSWTYFINGLLCRGLILLVYLYHWFTQLVTQSEYTMIPYIIHIVAAERKQLIEQGKTS